MKKNKPLQRTKALRSLSIDHHHGLLLCWKIRTGIKNNTDPSRIATYVKWFYQNHLVPHFEIEETYVFPVLAQDDELVARALEGHRLISTWVTAQLDNKKALKRLADLLESHIRMEERELFARIQQALTPQELEQIEAVHHGEVFCENDTDRFW